MHTIYQTRQGRVLQNDSNNSFYFQFKAQEYRMAVCALIAFKRKLDDLNIEEMLLSDPSINAVEIIPLCNREHILVLTLDEIIEIKDLISGTLVMLELNSIVHQRLVRAIV